MEPTIAHQQVAALKVLAKLFLEPNNVFLFGFLFMLGRALKWIHKFPDWGILFGVGCAGIGVGIGLLTATLHLHPWLISMMMGTVDAILAVFAHQILKQVFESPLGRAAMRWPVVPWIAVIAGVFKAVPLAQPAPKPGGRKKHGS